MVNSKGSAAKISLVMSKDKSVSEALQTSLFEAVFSNLDKTMSVAISNAKGEFIYLSPSFLQLSGYSEQELEGQAHRIFNSGLHSNLFWRQMWESLLDGQIWRGEIRNKKKSGEYFWTHTTIVPVLLEGYSEYFFLEYRKDISARKQKDLVAESTENLQLLLSSTLDRGTAFGHFLAELLILTDSDWALGVELYKNHESNYDFSFKSLQIQYAQNHPQEFILRRDEYSEFLKIFEPVIQGQKPLVVNQGQLSRRSQIALNQMVHRFDSFIGFPIQKGNNVIAVVGLANRRAGYRESMLQAWLPMCQQLVRSFESIDEVNKQKSLDEELKNHLILLEQSQQVAEIGGWAYDLETQKIFWTRQLYVLFGCDPTVFKPDVMSFETFVQRSSVDELRSRLQSLVVRLEEFDLIVPMAPQLGEDRWLRILGRPQYNNGKVQKVIGAVQEVTQLRRKELEIEDHRKKAMANARATALGQMAGGIAHEINNPLTIVLGTAKHFRMASDRGELTKEIVEVGSEKIVNATTRISKVIKGLKAFAREGSKDPIVDCAASSIVDDALTFCQARVKNHGIKMEFLQPQNEGRLRCRPVEMSQALLNLILNSDSAIRGTEKPWIHISFDQEGDWSIFRVTDSGTGIPTAVADRMMEAFYTTRDPGMGMGLGLSVVAAIVAAHSGQFFLDRQSANTSFVIKIPRKI